NIPYDNTHDSYKMPIDTILVREVDKPDNYTENTVNLNIQDVNQAPVISSIGYKSIDGGDTLEFTVSAKDPDGDNLRDLKAINLPKGAEFKILPRIAKYSNPNIQGVFTWTPDYNQSGEYKVTFTVSDGALIGEEAINITVNNVNRPLEVTTNIATGIQTTQATLNGALGKLGNDSSAEVWFEYGTDANYGNSTPLQTKTAIGDFNAPITGLSSNNTYHFRAVARNNDGISYGANMSFTTPISIPATPTNLTATASDSTQIDLNWQDNSKNETGFKIERSLNPNAVSKNWSQIATVSKDVTTYSNLNLNANTTYYYRVKAYNEKGESGYSNIANAKTPAKAYSISGKVYTVNGRRQLPLEGATVILYLPKALTKTTTGSDGSYQFKNVPSGTYTIIASKKGYPSQLQRIKVNASLMNVNFLSKS
ncbi:MAG: carboxypeptidase regulatory-like domain-containing protein, partial [Candidatus Omnitrophica bacterium]|nr:carboxypeptidase regulatory-like domain-containing protein [Candidatus Omnitrophota bacterium]